MKKSKQNDTTDPAPARPESLAVKDGDVIRLERSGIRACGQFRAGVDYQVGTGQGQVAPERAHRLVTIKGFSVNPDKRPDNAKHEE